MPNKGKRTRKELLNQQVKLLNEIAAIDEELDELRTIRVKAVSLLDEIRQKLEQSDEEELDWFEEID